MEMIYDLVTNGLARLNLPLELNFLCIGLCQVILILWFFMHYVHENIVVGIDMWWFPYIIQKIMLFIDFLRHCFQFSKTYKVQCSCSRAEQWLAALLCFGCCSALLRLWLAAAVQFSSQWDAKQPRKKSPHVEISPGMVAGIKCPKNSTRVAFSLGLLHTCCQSRP
jgi:hypothetical protein